MRADGALAGVLPSLNAEIRNYMALIQACGRERDLMKALEVFEKLKASNCALDIAAYNCVLDVCAVVGEGT